jgi:hypothetical protein
MAIVWWGLFGFRVREWKRLPPRGVDREDAWMSSKRQQTFAKMERERKVREKRALKMEKKQAAAAERTAETADSPVAGQAVDSEEPDPP